MTTEHTDNTHLKYGMSAAGMCLALLMFIDIDGPDRAPKVTLLITNCAALLGALIVGISVFQIRPQLMVWRHPLSLVVGIAALGLGLGAGPEMFQLPMHGIGERIWGFPVALLAPLAGASLLRGAPVVAGLSSALLATGLLQPHAQLGDVKLALLHNIAPFAGLNSIGCLILLALAVLGLYSVYSRKAQPNGILPAVTAKLLLAALPLWELIQVFIAVEDKGNTAIPVAAFMLVTGSTALIYLGLKPAALREVKPKLSLSTEVIAVATLVVLWLLLKSFTWRWSSTDENIYFYNAVLLTKGQLPYRDFFFAHPPLHIAVPAAFFGLFGFNIMLAKLLPVLVTLLTGLVIWKLTRDVLGTICGFFTLATYLFAFELLQASTNLNGVNLTSLALTLGLFFVVKNRPVAAGIALGCAVCTGFYAIAGALALITLSLFRGMPGFRTLAYAAVVGCGINFLCWLVAGESFIDSVYRYHILKDEKPLAPVFIKMLYYHVPLFTGLALAPVMAAWQHFRGFSLLGSSPFSEQPGSFFSPFKLFNEPATGTVKIAWLLAVTLLIEMTLFNELYDFYFVLIFPAAAICTGYTIAALFSAVANEIKALSEARISWSFVVVIALGTVWTLQVPLAQEANWIFSAKRGKGVNYEYLNAGQRRTYRWIPPAVLPSIGTPVVGSLFWRDQRTKWHMAPNYRHFLWQKSLHVSVANDVANYVKKNSAPNETVAGGSLVAPMVALASERRIAANFVDTNAKRFKTKLTSVQQFVDRICKDNIRYLIAAPNGYINNRRLASIPAIRHYFQPVKVFEDPWNKFQRKGRRPWAITLWEVKNKDGERCRWRP